MIENLADCSRFFLQDFNGFCCIYDILYSSFKVYCREATPQHDTVTGETPGQQYVGTVSSQL